MPRKAKQVVEEVKEDENLFNAIDEDDSVDAADELEEPVPLKNSPEWNDFVLGLFLSDEFQDGNPTVDGLRRVAQYIYGEIVDEYPKTIVATPDFAVIEYSLEFSDRKVTAVAESNNRNNCVTPFCHFPAAIAETRAQGRALRKVLGLKKVVSAEEIASVTSEQGPTDFGGYIDGVQIATINNICKKNNIDVLKFISLEKQYGSIAEVKKEEALRMIEQLNKYQATSANQDSVDAPDSIRGYKKDWRNV